MNCETFFDHYFLYDKNESVPLGMKWHLVCCRSCRSIVTKIRTAEDLQRERLYAPFDADDRILQATMVAVYQRGKPHMSVANTEKSAALLPWFTAGIFLILGFTLLPFTESGKLWFVQFGDSYCIPFALLCALSIVAYAAVFLAKNLVFFTEKFMLTDDITCRQNKPLAGSCI